MIGQFARRAGTRAGCELQNVFRHPGSPEALTQLPGHQQGIGAARGCRGEQKRDAEEAVETLFEQFKASKVVVEDYLEGKEASYIVTVSGSHIVPFAASTLRIL